MKTYPLDRFVSDVPADLVCPICSEVVCRPRMCVKCEHLCCEECAADWARGCPNKCEPSSLVQAPRIVTRILEDLKVRCSGAQCSYIGRLADLRQHEEACEHLVMRCANPACDEKRKGPGCCSAACTDVLSLRDCVEASTCPETTLRHITLVLKKWERKYRAARRREKAKVHS